MRHGRILIVEDDVNLRRLTQAQLQKLGYETDEAATVPEALEVMKHEPPDLVISDLNLPGSSGLELLRIGRVEYPYTTFVMMTAFGTVESAVEAMKLGAYDYVTKPIHPAELRSLVGRVFERIKLIDEVQMLRKTIDEKWGFESIIGHSSSLAAVLDTAARVARTDAAVLIRGETGTGKELLAKSIHVNSARRERPFVVINCGAIPKELLESELFGHVKGAFTGAVAHKKGKIEMADGGTVFLDEIGEMPLEMQVRLLRMLQESEIEKVGGTVPTPVDVRIIAATHRDLEEMVAKGEFREDLYYRLAVVPIELPPLRQRLEDIPDLVQVFFQQSREKYGRQKLRLPESLIPCFSAYHWPGNVRQLLNTIVRLVVLTPGDEVTYEDLPEFMKEASGSRLPAHAQSTLESLERSMVLEALEKANWNQSMAARKLGITRKILIGRITKYQLHKRAG